MWQDKKSREIIDSIVSYYRQQVNYDPAGTITLVEQELVSQRIRQGNDWTGRGIVMDTVIDATLSALEIVHQACLEKLSDQGQTPAGD